jgi:hypothetical protein
MKTIKNIIGVAASICALLFIAALTVMAMTQASESNPIFVSAVSLSAIIGLSGSSILGLVYFEMISK